MKRTIFKGQHISWFSWFGGQETAQKKMVFSIEHRI